MNKVWFTSDLHYYHRNIVSYTNRGVATTQEDHDEWLIDLHNKQVHPSDIIYQLGDFCFNRRKPEDILKITNRLNGNIISIIGNHDSHEAFKKTGLQYYDLKSKHFEMSDGRKQQIVMCHYAMEIWREKQHGAWHLFGHSHGSFQPQEGKRVDVGLDNSYNVFGEHRYFDLESLEEYMKDRPLVHIDHHNERTTK